MKKIFWLMIFILLLLGGYTYWQNEYAQTPAIQEVKIELPAIQESAAETPAFEEKIEAPVTARVDISTPLTGDAQFEAYLDGSETPLNEAAWMPKFDRQGYVVQKNGNNLVINLKIKNDTSLRISLKGKYQLNENKQVMEHWVKYTAFTIDGKPVLAEPVEVWHNKPFKHTLNAKAGETYKLHFEWTKADK